MPDLDDESVVASKVFVDKRRKEVGGVKRRIVVDVVKLEVEKTFVVRRVVAEVVLVADDVAPLLGEKPRPVAPVLEDHPIRRKNSAIIYFILDLEVTFVWGAAIDQWIHLPLLFCHPGFESQADHLCFLFIVKLVPFLSLHC